MEPVQVQRKPKEAQNNTGPHQDPVTHQHPIQKQQHPTTTADVEALKSVVLQQTVSISEAVKAATLAAQAAAEMEEAVGAMQRMWQTSAGLQPQHAQQVHQAQVVAALAMIMEAAAIVAAARAIQQPIQQNLKKLPGDINNLIEKSISSV